jgi:hypothetical protein
MIDFELALTTPVSGEGVWAYQEGNMVMFFWIFYLKGDLSQQSASGWGRRSRIKYLDPRIEALSARLGKIFVGFEHDLVNACRDCFACLFCFFRAMRGQECYTTTIRVGDTNKWMSVRRPCPHACPIAYP